MADASSVRFWLSKRGSKTTEGPYDGVSVLALIQDGRIRARDQLNKSADERFWFDAGLLVAFPQLTCRYHDWLWCLRFNTNNVGAKGTALVAATLPVLISATLLGLSLFPAGTYPKIVLAAPGICVGLIFLYIFGYVVFKLPTWLAITMATVVTLTGIVALVALVRTLAA